MAWLLRKIRQSRWFPPLDSSWVPEGDIAADPLGDLATKDGALSVWVIDDERTNLERVVAALAGNCESLSHVDYALFDEHVAVQAHVAASRSRGNSPDEQANASWHRDLVKLSAGRLAELARRVFHQSEKGRRLPKEVRQLLVKAVGEGWMDLSRLKPKLRQKIAPLLANGAEHVP